MMDLLAIGAAGVRAFQSALTQVGDNVANADTPGYVRRSVRMTTGPAGAATPLSRDASGGAGVTASAIVRAGDALATNSARVAAGDHARYAARSEWLDRLQGVMTASDLDARLGGFFDAGTDLAAAPTSTAARTIFLDRTEQAAAGFRSLGTGLATLADDIASATTEATTTINAITSALGRVNSELRRTQDGGSAANGLRDDRDRLLAELAGHVRISVEDGPRGTVTVRLGTGGAAALLVATDGAATRIGVRDGANGAEIVLDPTHAAIAVRLPASGTLTGLVEAARQVAAARTDIDVLATRFGTAVNSWHAAGADANGDPGERLLATRDLTIIPGRANAGQAALDLGIADDTLLAADGYVMRRDAAGWTLARTDGSASVWGPGALTLDGVTVRPGSGARDGDSWTLAPAGPASALSLRPIGPARLAVADRFLTDAAAGNRGDAQLLLAADPAATGFAPAAPYRVTVTGPGAGILTDIATGTTLATLMLDGSTMTGAGFTFTLAGTPAVGDSFRILATGAGSNDNGNARALAHVRTGIGPGGTFEAALDARLASVGSQLSESKRLEATALAVRDDTAAAADAITGVDLDREAAELTRLQVAYRANAQILSAARDMFDTMLGILR
ncbi:flagellar hook-associated protein FlgK [Polymorphobacter fuscus]|uniref:Flagellar hook-associated protein 1 n=1 Tax=Sandarakinorhabdus fusca TaxID=1439888 RepID=A0A7C9GN91_9SPHN|nr:flagellar basal body rod C-terminal domain-containing protein [Polymorphobacter fuscus]KAB7648224.1 hypothetical protein F9290_00425 [Polymorphobacter fuscus]MQT15730.1 hypothetical protein [Polymorphobacter fuscus]NJC07999.1 flagellar hook-associated protein 1 FlgK [Polymorphobacter fuscus]